MAIQIFYFLNRYCLLFALIGMYVAIRLPAVDLMLTPRAEPSP